MQEAWRRAALHHPRAECPLRITASLFHAERDQAILRRMAQPIILAGDIGGTKTNLALCAPGGANGFTVIREGSFPSAGFPGLTEVVNTFLAGGSETVAASAFGIAGPVIDGRVDATNLPWTVNPEQLRSATGSQRIRLMNDLETTAYGTLFLDDTEIRTLHEGVKRRGNIAVIAAGTGLGQAILFWDGARHIPAATEGGHADFAPRNDFEFGLLKFLHARFARVSYERVLSGPGLKNIFDYLEQEGRPVELAVREKMKTEDPSAVIGRAGLDGSSAICAEALDHFVSLYGSQAGNLALTSMAVGGVYIGGGIVTKMIPKMESGAFMNSFLDKGRSRGLLEMMPVRIVLNAKASLIGAVHAALELLPD